MKRKIKSAIYILLLFFKGNEMSDVGSVDNFLQNKLMISFAEGWVSEITMKEDQQQKR